MVRGEQPPVGRGTDDAPAPRPGRSGRDQLSQRDVGLQSFGAHSFDCSHCWQRHPRGGGACAAAGRGAGRDPRTVSSRGRDASPVGGARSPSDHDMWRLCAWAVPSPCDGALACEPRSRGAARAGRRPARARRSAGGGAVVGAALGPPAPAGTAGTGRPGGRVSEPGGATAGRGGPPRRDGGAVDGIPGAAGSGRTLTVSGGRDGPGRPARRCGAADRACPRRWAG